MEEVIGSNPICSTRNYLGEQVSAILKAMKQFITSLLEFQAKRLLKKYNPTVIAVVGSVGKTSTKLNIATVLSQRYKVLAHYGSYNVPVAIPLAMFNMTIPLRLFNPFSWLRVLWNMEMQLSKPFDYDVLVLELGTDHPGEIEYFRKYLNPDIAVVTAVAPEHMEGFGTIDAVAKEELMVTHYSKKVLINRDDVSADFTKYVPDGTDLDTYGTSGIAEYRFVTDNAIPGQGFVGTFESPEYGKQKVTLKVLGEHNVRAVVAAGAVAAQLGMSAQEIVAGMQEVVPVHGRMNLLRGLENSTIIDDTYNSSPLAAIAALQTLYLFTTEQRIAILGSMNELGTYSKRAHQEVGRACDSALLDWVITIGSEAAKYLAPAAKERGCQVESFRSPYEAGAFVHKVMQQGAVILAKGSQNGVFAEEAIKVLMHESGEDSQLVRQSPEWMAIKQKQFGRFV